jgi:hypothetical protein
MHVIQCHQDHDDTARHVDRLDADPRAPRVSEARHGAQVGASTISHHSPPPVPVVTLPKQIPRRDTRKKAN